MGLSIFRLFIPITMVLASICSHSQESIFADDLLVPQIDAEKLKFRNIAADCARREDDFFQVNISGMGFYVPNRYSITLSSGAGTFLTSVLNIPSTQYLTSSISILPFRNIESLKTELAEDFGIDEDDWQILDYPQGMKMVEISNGPDSPPKVYLWIEEYLIYIQDYPEFATLFAESARPTCRLYARELLIPQLLNF